MSLRLRFTLTVALVAALATLVATTLSYRSTADRLDRAVDESLASSGGRMARQVERHGINLDKNQDPIIVSQAPVADATGSGRAIISVSPGDSGGRPYPPPGDSGPSRRGGPGSELVATQFVDTTGEVVAAPNIALPISDTDKQIARSEAKITNGRTVSIDGSEFRVLTIGVPGEGLVMVARNVDENAQVMRDLLRRFALLVAITSLVAALMAWMLARRATRRLLHLEHVVTAMATTGNLVPTVPLDTSGSDETARVAAAFQRLVTALQSSHEQQQRLVEDASHELRTPLTSLRTNLSLLPKLDRLGVEDRQHLVADVQSEVEEMVRLVNELVEQATASGQDSETAETVGLRDLAERCAAVVRRRTGRQVFVTGDDSLVHVGPTGLARAIGNLLGNAVKFDTSNAPVVVRVAKGEITVRDHGTGFEQADLPRVFDRFYRSETARSQPGSGLRLSIVSEVAQRWGGSVEAANSPDGGAVLTLRLPEVTEL